MRTLDHTLRARALAAIPPPTPQYRKPKLTPGRIVYLLYHAPRGAWEKGLVKTVRGWHGKRQLVRAVPRFVLHEPKNSATPIVLHVLIGARYVAEACLVSHSLAWAAGRVVEPHFYDDGTLTADDCALLKSKLPRACFHLKPEIEARLSRQLPADEFPCLNRLRPAYPHIRKLTDIHLFPGDWKCVSDADVLFFAAPTQLLGLLASQRACHMVDAMPAYGVPHSALEALAGVKVHPQVNVGLCHIPSAQLDWQFIEHCAATLLAEHGFTYYLEQALTAIVLARMQAVPLDANYVVYPDRATALRADSAAVHYVDDSRNYYYDFAWQQALNLGRPT